MTEVKKHIRSSEQLFLQTPPFSRLATQLVRYLSTFLSTGEWLRLAPSLLSSDAKKLLRFAAQQYYDKHAAALFKNVAAFQRMVTYSLSYLTQLTLSNVGVLPDPTTWQDWMQNATGLVDLTWIEQSVNHGRRVEGHIRALSLAIRRLQRLELTFEGTTSRPDDALLSGLLVDRDIGSRPLKELRISWGTPIQAETARRIFAAFPGLEAVRLNVEWNDSVLASLPPAAMDVILTAKEPRDWPDVKVVQAFFQQRPAWKLLSLAQGHLTMEIDHSEEEDNLPTFDLLEYENFKVDDDSPATLFPPDALIKYWTTLFSHWKKIDAYVPRFAPLVGALADWTWFSENGRVESFCLRCDAVLAPEDDLPWDDAKQAWLEEDDVKKIVRAINIGRMSKLFLSNDSQLIQPNVKRELLITKTQAKTTNLHLHTLDPWLLHLPPLTSVIVFQPQLTWSSDEIKSFLGKMRKRKDPLVTFEFGLDANFEDPVKMQPVTSCPTAEMSNWLPANTLRAFHVDVYPLDDASAFLRHTVPRLTNLRHVSLCSRQPIGRDELLMFPPELIDLSWFGRNAGQAMNQDVLMDVARRYRLLERLHLDIRPCTWSAQPPDSAFWRDWIALIPKLNYLTLSLNSIGFTWNEREVLKTVEHMAIRLVPRGSFARYHRYASPLDAGDNGGLRWSNSDDAVAIPMLDTLRRWPLRLVYALPDEAKWNWPDMQFSEDREIDIKRAFGKYVDFLGKSFNLMLGFPTQNYRWGALNDATGWFLFDRQKRTIEHLGYGKKVKWANLVWHIRNEDGWTAIPSWPDTWYRSTEDEGYGTYILGDDAAIVPSALRALYLTMRLLNPDVPAARIGQALFLPAGRPAIYDRFERFYVMTNRRLLSAPKLESKAMTDPKTTVSAVDQWWGRAIEHALQMPPERPPATPHVRIQRLDKECTVRLKGVMKPEAQILARDALRLVSLPGACQQVRFRSFSSGKDL